MISFKKNPTPFQGCGVFLILLSVSLFVSQAVFGDKETDASLTEPCPETQQIWAEVVSIDIPQNQVLVKYRDFDTQRENELLLSVDSQTKFETVFSLEYLRIDDAVVIDYIVTAQGNKLAKKIRLEGQLRGAWAEVISVDVPSKQIRVSYTDYDTESEKELMIWVDDSTVFENVSSLDGLKAGDTVNIDYVINPKGENIAKNITLQIYPEETKEPPT